MIQIISPQTTQCANEDTFHMLKRWITVHINRPIQGFEHKKNNDGSEYTRDQQISATRYQAIHVAHYFLSRGKSYDEILSVLKIFQ